MSTVESIRDSSLRLRNIYPVMKKYAVVGCSKCRNTWIVASNPDTTVCTRCGKSYKFSSLKKLHATDDKEEARQARTKAQARLNGTEHIVDGLMKKGRLTKSDEKETSVPKDKQIIQIIEELGSATEEQIAEKAEEHGIDKGKTFEYLQKLRMTGEIVKTPNGYRLV